MASAVAVPMSTETTSTNATAVTTSREVSDASHLMGSA